MGAFDKYSNKPDNAPFIGVSFGFGNPVLEVELNEAQQIQHNNMVSLLGIHGDCVINRDGFSYDGTTLTLNTKVVKDGIIIETNGATLALANGESAYISSEIVDYTYQDTIRANGNTAGAVIENTIKDNRLSIECTRRKGYKFTLNKESGMLLGTVTDGKFICLAKDYNSGIHRYITDSVSAPSKKGGIKVNRLYGKSEQKQYSGKNLLDFSNVKGGTNSGITISILDDDSYSLVGTATSNSINVWFKGAYNTSGVVLHLDEGIYYIKGVNIYKTSSEYGFNTGREGGFYTVESGGADFCGIRAVNCVVGTTYNEIIKPYIVKVSDESTIPNYEPYVGCAPSPSPSYPQEIKSTKNPTVVVLGKNIFYDTVVYENTSNGVTWNMSSGHITASGTPTGDSSLELSSFYTFLPKKNKYTLSLQGTTTNVIMKLLLVDSKLTVVGTLTGNVITLDISNYEHVMGYSVKFCSVESGVEVKCDAYLQLENSDTKTAYEPSSCISAFLPHTLNAVPVESGGNVTIDGQQYISDYIDFEKKQLIRMVGKIESYNSEEITTNYISTSGELSTGATVLYELSVPTTIDLTDEEVKPFLELNSHSGVTNIFASSASSEYGIITPPILDFEISTTETGAKSLENKNKCTTIAGEVASMTRIVVSDTEPDDKSVVWVQ